MRGSERVLFELEGDAKKVEQVFKSFPDVTSVQIDKKNKNLLKIAVESKKDLRKEFAQALVSKKISLLEMQSDKVTLEDIFLDLTTKEEEV
jgi:ABC-2 type transport system ATP-binding protein